MRNTDPVIEASDTLRAADDKFEEALSNGDQTAGDYWQDELMRLDQVFAEAIPTTAAGIRMKTEAICKALSAYDDGGELTPRGAMLARLHTETLAKAITLPRAVI